MRTLLALLLLLAAPAAAQFLDDFEALALDPSGKGGWRFRTGEGEVTMDLVQGGPGFASIVVDATADRRNVWWALIQREIASGIDLSRLADPRTELRIEARIRVSHAPRRVNLQVQTQRTVDYHAHLMEYDIPRADEWRTISMTTRGFDARPSDTLVAHMALMDWGRARYRVDVDYVKLDLVDVRAAAPDRGEPLPYHPPVADPASFKHAKRVAHDTTLDLAHPRVNFDDWSSQGARLVAVEGTRIAILRWDLAAFAGKKVAGSGLLELTTHSVAKKAQNPRDFGLLRVVEILEGDPEWDEANVTTASFLRGEPLEDVLNPQMIVDWPVAEGDGAKTLLTIPRPVLQRLLDGTTHGIAIQPLGAISATFQAGEARLLFDLKD